MSLDEKQSTNTEWTVDTLYIHLSRVLSDLAHRMDIELESRDKLSVSDRQVINVSILAVEKTAAMAQLSSEKAIQKAEVATEKRFDSVNEFRATLTDQAARLATKEALAGFQSAFDDKIRELTARVGRVEDTKIGAIESQSALAARVTLALLAAGVLVSILLGIAGYLHH